MKWHVFNTGSDHSVKNSYKNAITIGYLLNFNVISVGMSYKLYSLEEDSEFFSFESKMRLLADMLEDSELNETILNGIKCTKDYLKTKNKTVQQIVAYKNLKDTLLKIYKTNTEILFKTLNITHGFESFRKILTKDNYYFNSHWGGNDKTHSTTFAMKKILQLDFPQSENESSLFIINDFINSEEEINAFLFYSSINNEAKKTNEVYLEELCSFPEVYEMSVTELKKAKNQLEEPTKILLNSINQWAYLCHQNPSTTKGLTYFKKEIKPLLATAKNLCYESTIIKNHFKKEPLNTIQIFIGEAPLEKIWDIYFAAGIIREVSFQKLVALKKEQNPKHKGRYPIIYIKNLNSEAIKKNKSESETVPEENTVVSVRKTISID